VKRDLWGRPSAVEDAADVSSRYMRQGEFHLNTVRDATPEELQEWIDEKGTYEETVSTVLRTIVLGSIFQFCTFGMMILAFYLIDRGL
tara:strand:- start:2668 stop:2931 length:264 start_codon:yes stop_codon:yes gene_type:complete